MTKLSWIYILSFVFILSPLLVHSQQLDRRLGEILFQTNETISHQDIIYLLQNNIDKNLNTNDLSTISAPLNIWKLTIDHNQKNELDFLDKIKKVSFITTAQFNFFTENRTEPNDPYFSNAWYLYNYGQTGGTIGVDLDATLAWSETTGGISYTGDTIVVCVLDERFDYNHSDLHDNVWVNYDEIPENGIDDDNNGYIDDYWGWNVVTEDDQVINTSSSDWHGTSVSGVIGAVGNNDEGISGANWNVKMMLVSRGDDTADAIASYTYPFLNRKLYNQSLGQNGAFIVATNSSWGLNFGTPDEAPLWCAMYDSLGSVGILNATATTNNNYNVDEVGDLPTTCLSDYLITVTSVDEYDLKVTNAGYGAQSVDVGAFGKNIYSTLNYGLYGTLNGTSVATPQVTGLISLLHAAPCPSFAVFAKNNPSQAALVLKDYIINGTESNASLSGITTSGGRINYNNSIDLLMNNCDFSGCFAPYQIEINALMNTSASIEWLTDIATDNVNIRYRKINTTTWTNIINIQSPMVLNGLMPCTNYEFQLQSQCDGTMSAFTASFSFKTEGCCEPPEISTFENNNMSIEVTWIEVPPALSYTVRARPIGSPSWIEFNTEQTFFTFSNLEECQEYEFQISTVCASFQTNFSSSYFYSTLGCGACLDFDYCQSSGPAGSFSWISHVEIADLDFDSGNSNNGYSNHSDQSIHLIQGFIHEIQIETDFDFIQFPGFFSIWIDLDQGGYFSNDELLYQSIVEELSISKILFIHQEAVLGSTRMRISFSDSLIDACENSYSFGEVEDYCVDIIEPSECLPPVNFSYSTTDTSALLSWSGNLLINEYNLIYRQVGAPTWLTQQTVANNYTIPNLIPCTEYEFYIVSNCGGETSSPSPTHRFATKGCGACLDYTYCTTIPCDIDFEWIERVTLNDIDNQSGPNDGYMNFPDHTTNLLSGNLYPIVLEPGFSNDVFDELFYIWIDFNQDGIFDQDEKVLETLSQGGSPINTSIAIPVDAQVGSTKMRISMKYADEITDACESGFFGEIEEYCINIYSNSSQGCQESDWILNEPIDTFSTNIYWADVDAAVAYKMRYRPLNMSAEWEYVTTSYNNYTVTDLLVCEDYEAQVQTICDSGLSTFSDSYIFNGCFVTSNNEVELDPLISIYPNPFNQSTTLSINNLQEELIKVEIYSLIGQYISGTKHLLSQGLNTIQLDFQSINPGIYFVKISTSEKLITTQRIIHQTP